MQPHAGVSWVIPGLGFAKTNMSGWKGTHFYAATWILLLISPCLEIGPNHSGITGQELGSSHVPASPRSS